MGLMGHGLTPPRQESSPTRGGAIQPIEEVTSSWSSSAQLVSLHPKDGNDDFGEQYTTVDKSTSADKAQGYTKIKHDSPWNTYEAGYDLKLHEFVTVAVRKAPQRGKVAIRQFAGPDVHHKLHMLHRISHERFVTMMEIFEYQKTWYAVFEHVVISLTQVVNSPPYPTEGQLSAIVGQVS